MFFYIRERFYMKIVNFENYKKSVNKLDGMAQIDMSKINSVFPQNFDETIREKMKKFFEVADGGNPEWNV